MKTLVWIFSFCCLAFHMQAQTNIALYEKSLAQFEAGKKEHKDSYVFALKKNIFPSGSVPAVETFFVVREGKIVERRYKRKQGDRFAWVEFSEQIGQHKEGAPAQTLTEIYADAKKFALLADEPKLENVPLAYANYFSLRSDGILQIAGLQRKSCHDDCFTGYYISHFAWGAPQRSK